MRDQDFARKNAFVFLHLFIRNLTSTVQYIINTGRIKARIPARWTGDDLVCIMVEDTGMGIKKDEMQHIWDRLYRGDESLSVPGLGLGLSLVRAIVQAHGGSIELSSTPGRGSKFTVSIPLNM